MKNLRKNAAIWMGIGLGLAMTACGGGGTSTPVQTTYTLTVNSSNPATGVAIGVTPADNSGAANGSTSFTRTYNSGTSVTLTAPATSGTDTFASWTGCTTASTVTCTVAVNANTTVTANYNVPTYVLTVNSTNPASGVAIGVTPADNNSAANGSTSFTRTYNSGTAVTLTAPATSGIDTFASWTGCTTTSGVTCTVTVNANATVTANYTVPTYVLTVNSTNPASGVAISYNDALNNVILSGTTSFAVTYPAGTPLILTAPATAGSNNFSSWTGCTTASTETCDVTLNANMTVTANYKAAPNYVLTVDSTNPASGVTITVGYPPTTLSSQGITSFTLNGGSGSMFTLTAPATVGSNTFASWSGCTTASTETCDVTLDADMTVTANYTVPAVAVTPNPATVNIGSQLQFTAAVSGTVSSAVTWSVAAPSGSSLSPGTISSTGLYTTPYPAPATVTVTATSTQNTGKSGSVTVTLQTPATAAGPALTVNVGSPGNAINPDIYGMNAYYLDTASATTAHASVARWGGDDISRYNYQTNTTNSASDWYFENFTGAGNMWGGGSFTGLLTTAASVGTKTLGTAPVLGWVANSTVGACSFTQAAFPGQESYNGPCGDGIYAEGSGGCTDSDGCDIFGTGTTAFADVTSISEPPPTPPAASAATAQWAQGTWAGSWVNSLVTNPSYGNAASGKGVAIWDLDNEPTWWSAVHRDVHPDPFTYDEVTNGGIGTALAIKTADSTAAVSGPVVDYWWAYFYSMKDIWSGWSTGPCYEPWDNPTDRAAHQGVPLIEYYLQQFKTAENTYGMRLLDYVDLHTYFAAANTGLTAAGDTATQQARMNSTRVFWDPTYTDFNYPQPNYTTDSNYTSSCNPPAQAPQLIPMMKTWVANDYPGTKLSIDEYNFGGLEAINGAVTQADILGIFGREGLDLGALWPTGAYETQGPGNMAFAIYRNYDGKNSTVGDTVLPSTSANQGTLSVYGALRSTDNAVTVVVINKTYGPLTSTISLTGLSSTATTAQAYLYSNANLAAIVAQPAVTVTPGGSTSTISNYNFPAQSITLFVVPQ